MITFLHLWCAIFRMNSAPSEIRMNQESGVQQADSQPHAAHTDSAAVRRNLQGGTGFCRLTNWSRKNPEVGGWGGISLVEQQPERLSWHETSWLLFSLPWLSPGFRPTDRQTNQIRCTWGTKSSHTSSSSSPTCSFCYRSHSRSSHNQRLNSVTPCQSRVSTTKHFSL